MRRPHSRLSTLLPLPSLPAASDSRRSSLLPARRSTRLRAALGVLVGPVVHAGAGQKGC